jgi:hypothetical protein
MHKYTAPVIPAELSSYWDETVQAAHEYYALRSLATIVNEMPPLRHVFDERAAAYAEIPRQDDVPQDRAVVVPLPYGCGWTPDKAIRVGMLAKGLPAELGRLIVLPNNSMADKHVYDFTEEERAQVAHGDFAPIAVAGFRTLEQLGIERIQYDCYSQAAAVGAVGIRLATTPGKEYFDVARSGLFASPTAGDPWRTSELRSAFGRSKFDQDVKQAAIPALSEAMFGTGVVSNVRGFLRYVHGLTLDPNVAIRHGFHTPHFIRDVTTAIKADKNLHVTLGGGRNDRLMRCQAWRNMDNLAALYSEQITVLRVADKGHGLADNVVANLLMARMALLDNADEVTA